MLQRIQIEDLPEPEPTAEWAAWLRLHGPDVASTGADNGWDFRAASRAFDAVMEVERRI